MGVVSRSSRVGATAWSCLKTKSCACRCSCPRAQTSSSSAISPLLGGSGRSPKRGALRVQYSWGQRPGFGPPLLTEDSLIDLPGGTVCTSPTPLFENYRLAPGQRTAWPHGIDLGGAQIRVDQV